MKEKRSYSIGVNMAQSLKQSGLEVDPKSVAAGLTDALSGGKLQMTDEEMKSTLQGLQAEMQAKMQEKAAAAEAKVKADAPKNQKASDEFLAANKKKDDISDDRQRSAV
ncbi:MAG: FKBP-type peptidyl-prolyl cis-trans isomerase N-terminal domain-containing protein [Chthoniobacteraceae bacterium]